MPIENISNIVEVQQNWPSNLLRVEVILGNYCNYKCWYCWPGSNAGTVKFPNVDLAIKNISHLLNYYKEHTGKTKFDLSLLGGEPTHWPQFIKFVSYFKENYDCIITMKSNGSKGISWWNDAAPYLDDVAISVHHEFADLDHIKSVCDFLYDKDVSVNAQVMMDPFAWDKCIYIVEYLKTSDKKWAIRYSELIDDKINYTEEQRTLINKVRARSRDQDWGLRVSVQHFKKIYVIDDQNKKTNVSEKTIILYGLNKFLGWECNLGVDWICIAPTGQIIGNCPNKVYDNDYYVYSDDFIEKFNPKIKPVICFQSKCVCSFDTVMNKKKLKNK